LLIPKAARQIADEEKSLTEQLQVKEGRFEGRYKGRYQSRYKGRYKATQLKKIYPYDG
jgi:hypothetical protein